VSQLLKHHFADPIGFLAITSDPNRIPIAEVDGVIYRFWMNFGSAIIVGAKTCFRRHILPGTQSVTGPKIIADDIFQLWWCEKCQLFYRRDQVHDRCYQILRVPEDPSEYRHPLSCRILCDKPQLRRPHFTCRICRLRKVLDGKEPKIMEVVPYFFFMSYRCRHHSPWRKAIYKKLMSLLEFLSNY